MREQEGGYYLTLLLWGEIIIFEPLGTKGKSTFINTNCTNHSTQ